MKTVNINVKFKRIKFKLKLVQIYLLALFSVKRAEKALENLDVRKYIKV